jgi:hypothetical protein
MMTNTTKQQFLSWQWAPIALIQAIVHIED